VVREIPLSQGFVALADDVDADQVEAWKWHASRRGNALYAARNVRRGDGSVRLQYLHRFLMDPPPGIDVDHIDGDPLNNRRSNLRLATRQENLRNGRNRQVGASGFRGVRRLSGCWQARLWDGTRFMRLGCFDTPEEAAVAFDAAVKRLHGEFAVVNFPEAA